MELIGARAVGDMRCYWCFGRAGLGNGLGGPLHYSLLATGGWLSTTPGRLANARPRHLAPSDAGLQPQSGVAQDVRRCIQSPQWDDPMAATLPTETPAKSFNSGGLLRVPAILEILWLFQRLRLRHWKLISSN
jgi:hypothetical protein